MIEVKVRVSPTDTLWLPGKPGKLEVELTAIECAMAGVDNVLTRDKLNGRPEGTEAAGAEEYARVKETLKDDEVGVLTRTRAQRENWNV